MTTMERVGEQEFFRKILSLQGKEVEVSLSTSGELLRGRIVNTMFDSFLIEVKGKNRVVAFSEILFLDDIR